MYIYYDYDLSGWLYIVNDSEDETEDDSVETTATEDPAATATPASDEAVPGDENLVLLVDTTTVIDQRLEQIQTAVFGCLLLLAAVVLLSIFNRLWGSI